MIDGYQVNVKDRVFVVGMGEGVVTAVHRDGGFVVKLPHGTVNVSNGGYIGKTRKIYWHDPIFITPPKDKKLWKTFKRAATDDYNMIAAIMAGTYAEDLE